MMRISDRRRHLRVDAFTARQVVGIVLLALLMLIVTAVFSSSSAHTETLPLVKAPPSPKAVLSADPEAMLFMLGVLSDASFRMLSGDSFTLPALSFPGYTARGFKTAGILSCVQVDGFPNGPWKATSGLVAPGSCLGMQVWVSQYGIPV